MRNYLSAIFSVLLYVAAAPVFALTPQESQLNSKLAHLQAHPGQLQAFIQAMPKGADLHNHLGGAAYPEQLLTYAEADQFCLRANDLTAFVGDCSAADRLNTLDVQEPMRDRIIDAWSMRHFRAEKTPFGHDHFFAAFGKFSAIGNQHIADILAELKRHAALQHIHYLELMMTLDKDASGRLGKTLGYTPDFKAMQEKLMQNGLPAIVAAMTPTLDAYETAANQKLACGEHAEAPAWRVTVRYLYQVLREQPPEMVFAQLLAGFLAAQQDARVVGLNMVQPEDGNISMRDYHLHMQMIGFLKQQFPQVKVSLHAGEITSDFVSQQGLSFHINEAVHVAHADRIGHGVDINQENNRDQLLAYMADHHIAVEINLTSNANILGISGNQHPIATYQKFAVPVTLSTDDEGITRSSLSQEYKRAVLLQHFSYTDLKAASRASLEYAFVSGHSLWQNFTSQVPVAACVNSLPPAKMHAACETYVNKNEKARLQYALEAAWQQFEMQQIIS